MSCTASRALHVRSEAILVSSLTESSAVPPGVPRASARKTADAVDSPNISWHSFCIASVSDAAVRMLRHCLTSLREEISRLTVALVVSQCVLDLRDVPNRLCVFLPRKTAVGFAACISNVARVVL